MEKKIIDSERRKDLRLGIAKPLMLRFQVKRQEDIFNLLSKKVAAAEDMSVGGISMELPALDRGQIERIIKGQDKLVLELEVPRLRKPLKIIGKIVWLKKRDRRGRTVHVAGISFAGIKEKDREKLLLQLINLCLKSKANI